MDQTRSKQLWLILGFSPKLNVATQIILLWLYIAIYIYIYLYPHDVPHVQLVFFPRIAMAAMPCFTGFWWISTGLRQLLSSPNVIAFSAAISSAEQLAKHVLIWFNMGIYWDIYINIYIYIVKSRS